MEFVRPPLGKAGLFEERAKRFQARTVYARQETTEAGAMGKLSAPKQGHERSIKGSYPLKEVGERPFSADGIADQQD